MPVKLVEVIRGDVIESVHRGDIVVVNSEGEILFERGDSERICFFRSISKPFHALTAIHHGTNEKFALSLREIALVTGSHSGDNDHIEALLSAMEKTEITEEMLQCGIHEPLGKDAVKKIRDAGHKPSKLHSNCSGKHLGLIATSKAIGAPSGDYFKIDHPVQHELRKVISEFSRVQLDDIKLGVDGCGVPVHAVPLKNIAMAYANLCSIRFADGKYRRAQEMVIEAMTSNPDMVAGKGRLDTELMTHFGDRLLCKFGEEGMYAIGLRDKSIGIALKIEDGNIRAIGPAILELLTKLKIIRCDEAGVVSYIKNPVILNHKGEKVGEIRPAYE